MLLVVAASIRSKTSFSVSTVGSMVICLPSTVMVPALMGGLKPLLANMPEETLVDEYRLAPTPKAPAVLEAVANWVTLKA